jgi:surface antigen
MNKIDESTLMSYVDGELDPELSAEIEQRIATDLTLQRDIDKIRRIDSSVKAAFQHALYTASDNTVVGIDSRSKKRPIRPGMYTWQRNLLLAASLAGVFFLGAASIKLIQPGSTPNQERTLTSAVAQDPLFQETLEKQPSRHVARWLDDSNFPNHSLRLIQTFRTKNGIYCREFVLSIESTEEKALACRNKSGHWSVKLRYLSI